MHWLATFGEVGGDLLEVARLPAVVALLWVMHRIMRYLYRDDRAAMKQFNELLAEDNTRLRKEVVDLRVECAQLRRTIRRAEEHLLVFALETGKSPPDLDDEPMRKGEA